MDPSIYPPIENGAEAIPGRSPAIAGMTIVTTDRLDARIDAVDHPPHYQAGGLEAIDVIEAFGLNFRLGNAVKYLLRAGRKGDAKTDIAKARWYIDRELAALERAP